MPKSHDVSLKKDQEASELAHHIWTLLNFPSQNGLFKSFLSRKALYALFWKRNSKVLAKLREELQNDLDALFELVRDKTFSPEENQRILLAINTRLSNYPSTEPNHDHLLRVPECIEGKWQLVLYRPHAIELTPTRGFKNLFLRKKDRMYAWGLEPWRNEEASPRIIFMDVPYYPTALGFFSALEAYFSGFKMPGENLYNSSKNNILQWMQPFRRQGRLIQALGKGGLGGAFAEMLALDVGDALSSAVLINAPGDIDRFWSHKPVSFDKWATLSRKPKCEVFRYTNNWLAHQGILKKEFHLYEVTPPETMDTNFEEINYQRIDNIHEDNKRRKWRNFLMFMLFRSTFYYLFFMPFRYLILPIYRVVMDHKIMLFFGILVMTLFLTLGLSTPMILPSIFVAFGSGYIIENMCFFIFEIWRKKQHSDLLNFFISFLNLSLSGKITRGALICMLLIGLIACFALYAFIVLPGGSVPIAAFAIALAMVCVPLVIKLGAVVWSSLKKLLGFEKVKPLVFDEMTLSCTEAQDIYLRSESHFFKSSEEVYWFFKAKRTLEKKTVIPTTIRKHPHTIFFQDDQNLSKKDFLTNFDHYDGRDRGVKITASEAKIDFMKKSILLFNSKKDLSDQVLSQFKTLHEDYKRGKKGHLGRAPVEMDEDSEISDFSLGG